MSKNHPHVCSLQNTCNQTLVLASPSLRRRTVICFVDSSVGIALGYGLGISLFTTASRTALGPTQPPIQWVPGALSLGVKRPGREADHSLPSSAEIKEWVELYLHSPNTPPWRGAQLKSTGTTLPFTFTFTYWCIVQTRPVSNECAMYFVGSSNRVGLKVDWELAQQELWTSQVL
jgi:hypothetical protein